MLIYYLRKQTIGQPGEKTYGGRVSEGSGRSSPPTIRPGVVVVIYATSEERLGRWVRPTGVPGANLARGGCGARAGEVCGGMYYEGRG